MKEFYKKEFYHTREDAYEAAKSAAGETGFVEDNQMTSAEHFDFIALDAICDERSGDVRAFIADDEDGSIVGIFAYAN